MELFRFRGVGGHGLRYAKRFRSVSSQLHRLSDRSMLSNRLSELSNRLSELFGEAGNRLSELFGRHKCQKALTTYYRSVYMMVLRTGTWVYSTVGNVGIGISD